VNNTAMQDIRSEEIQRFIKRQKEIGEDDGKKKLWKGVGIRQNKEWQQILPSDSVQGER